MKLAAVVPKRSQLDDTPELFECLRATPPKQEREAARMNRASTSALIALMLTHRDMIRHPDPEAAIQCAVLALASVIRAVIIDEDQPPGLNAPDNVEQELTRMIFGYLGIEGE